MYEFWYEYVKPKCQNKAKLCYMDNDSFIMHIKTEDFYEDIVGDVEKWFDRSNHIKGDKRPLLYGKKKKKLVYSKMN